MPSDKQQEVDFTAAMALLVPQDVGPEMLDNIKEMLAAPVYAVDRDFPELRISNAK